MSKEINQIYEFGEFHLETAERLLLRAGKPISLTPKAFEMLLALIRSGGHVVEKDELMEQVWPDAFVEEANLARHVWALRKALGDDDDAHQYIETVPKLGYRFVASVTEVPDRAEVLIQRRIRAHIVSEEADTTEALAVPTKVGTRGRLTTGSMALTVATGRSHRRRNIVLAVVGLLAVTIIGGLLVRKARSKPSPKAIESVAVLPFTNLSNDPELDYLTDGITEGLINHLSQMPQLKIIAHNSVFHYKGQEVDAKEVGKILGVQALLVGRVAQHGDDLSISTELIDTSDGSHIWGTRHDRKTSDLRFLQQELPQDIARSLSSRLTSADQKPDARRYTEDAEAYQNYLKGRYFWNKRTEAGLQKGIEYFQTSVARDPNYALAYAGLADSYIMQANWRFAPAAGAYQEARAAALRALELDPDLAEAKTSLAYSTLLYQWDWNGAEKGFREAIALNPNYASAHHFYSICLLTAGRQREALAEIQRAQELDPLSLIITSVHGWIFYEERQYDHAAEYFGKTLEMDSQYVPALLDLGECQLRRGDSHKAMEEFQKARSVDGDTSRVLADIAQAYALSGQQSSALKIVKQLEEVSSSRFVSPWDLSFVYAALGDKARAIQMLDKSIDEKVGWVTSLGVDPGFDSLRDDPRFEKLKQRVGIPN
jgi:TolB-like protein/DNA-binding winged helix-turn-helix (wHTH) protein/Tfp pilus assembly protein PilF